MQFLCQFITATEIWLQTTHQRPNSNRRSGRNWRIRAEKIINCLENDKLGKFIHTFWTVSTKREVTHQIYFERNLILGKGSNDKKNVTAQPRAHYSRQIVAYIIMRFRIKKDKKFKK